MIDMIKAKEAFKNYVKNYNPENDKIRIKIAHIERTSQRAKEIALSLNLNEEDVKLAELIGLLHDIGRFEQVRKYNTFRDKDSVNHGEYGAWLLFEQGLINNFGQEEKYNEIIKKAILNHNRAKIEEGLTDRELLHCKIIRDADKTDIFYVLTVDKLETAYETKNFPEEKMSDEIYREFKEEKTINYANMKGAADLIVAHFAYIYDLYFDYSLKYIYDNNYLEKLYNRVVFKDEKTSKYYNEIYEIAKQYIEKRIKDDKIGQKATNN